MQEVVAAAIGFEQRVKNASPRAALPGGTWNSMPQWMRSSLKAANGMAWAPDSQLCKVRSVTCRNFAHWARESPSERYMARSFLPCNLRAWRTWPGMMPRYVALDNVYSLLSY